CSEFFLSSSARHPSPRSFPTRRSSDLARFLPRDEVDPILRASNTAGWVLNLQDQANKDLLDRKLLLDSAFAQMRAAIATMHARQDRKSTRLNSSHVKSSYAVFCLKKKN